MSSPIGHILGALAVQRSLRPLASRETPSGAEALILVSILAYIPDLDVVLVWILGDSGAHRGFTHSILFAGILAVAGTLGYAATVRSWRKVSASATLVLFAACLVHPALDILMGCGPPVALFAPFSSTAYLAPMKFVPTAYFATSPLGILRLLVFRPSVQGALLEVWILLPLFLATRPRLSWGWRAPLLLVAATGFAASFVIYN